MNKRSDAWDLKWLFLCLKINKMDIQEFHLEGRKNDYFYLIEIEKEYYKPFKKIMFKATYSNGFGKWSCHYYLGENIPSIIEL